MLQRGRKGSATLTAPPVDGHAPRLEPPSSLSEAERQVFIGLVSACDRKHFRVSDLPLLSSYVRAIVLEERAARELGLNPLDKGWLGVWEKSGRALVSLAARLRLSPQSRQHPRTAARLPEQAFPRPWE
jgi:hypothetical protein